MHDHKEAQRGPVQRGQSRWPFVSVPLVFLALGTACDHALSSLHLLSTRGPGRWKGDQEAGSTSES